MALCQLQAGLPESYLLQSTAEWLPERCKAIESGRYVQIRDHKHECPFFALHTSQERGGNNTTILISSGQKDVIFFRLLACSPHSGRVNFPLIHGVRSTFDPRQLLCDFSPAARQRLA